MAFKNCKEIFWVGGFKIEFEIKDTVEINMCVGHWICQTLCETSAFNKEYYSNGGSVLGFIKQLL